MESEGGASGYLFALFLYAQVFARKKERRCYKDVGSELRNPNPALSRSAKLGNGLKLAHGDQPRE